MTDPQEPQRPAEEIDTRRRELQPDVARAFQPLTGIPYTLEENRVYEYGRLMTREFFGERVDLGQAREELRIRTDQEQLIASNVALIYRYLEYQNRRDFRGIIDIHHNPYLNKTFFGRWPVSPEAHVRGLRGWFHINPDATTEANKIIVAAENTVVIRCTARGTQVKSFPGSMMGRRGKQWATSLIHAIEVVDGKIAGFESVSPFENQWEEPFINSNFPGLGSDISEVRARQGVNADYEYLAEAVIGDQTIRAMHAGSDPEAMRPPPEGDILGLIRRLHEQGPNQCQTLIPPRMRRCAKVRVGDSLWCKFHQEHGFGIDDEY